MTSGTDKLRRLLDERGVFWVDIPRKDMTRTVWKERDGQLGYCYFDENEYGVTTLLVSSPTPAQAIAATLGSCNCPNNCTNGERTETCHMEQTGHVKVAGVDYYDDDYECSECGAEIFEGYNFCPMCGRRIEQ